MSKAWRIFSQEFRTNFRRKSYLIVTFVVPLVLSAIVTVVMPLLSGGGGDGNDVQMPGMPEPDSSVVGLVDQSGLFLPPEPDSPFAQYIRPYADEAAAREALEAGEVHSYFVIDGNYLESGVAFRYAEQLDLLGGLIGEERVVRNFLTLQMLGDTDPNVYLRLVDPVNFDRHTVSLTPEAGAPEAGAEEEELRGKGASFLLSYIFGLLIYMGTLFASGYLSTGIAREKENRVVEIILSSIKPFPLLVGKVLAAGALGLLQVAAYILTMWLLAPKVATQFAALAGLEVPPRLLVFGLVYFVGGFFMIGGLFAAVAALVERAQNAQQFATLIVLPALLPPLLFMSEFAEAPHGTLSTFLSMFPLTAPMSMVMRLSAAEVPAMQIIISLALVALGAVASIWFAARLFRVNTLLAGQTPKLRDVWRLVRES
jgi:ABC-2 type transport system permease protein